MPLVEECGRVTIKSKEELVIKKASPPDEGYQPKLLKFFPYTASVWDEEKKRRFEGRLEGLSRDFFFVGEIGGELVGNAWYTVPEDMAEVATLGFVYTKPDRRRKGVATNLMEAALNDFFDKSGSPSAIYLNTGLDNPAHDIYAKFGFKDYNTRMKDTVMRLARPSDREFDDEYFGWKGKAHIRKPHRGDLPRFEALFNRPGWVVKDFTHGVLGNPPYERQFILTMNAVDSGFACSSVLENPKGRVVGCALLTFHSKAEGWGMDWALLDFLVFPEYGNQGPELVEEMVRRSGGMVLRSYAAVDDRAKIVVLEGLGFRSEEETEMRVDGRDLPIRFYSR